MRISGPASSPCASDADLIPVASGSDTSREPTPEQAAVINAPDERLIVLAGPGTGKTFTLVARVSRLAATGSSPVVLSFTRAVVREMHHRLRDESVEAPRYVRPVTFDSFATRLLGGLP